MRKIIQIMPADNWWIRYKAENGKYEYGKALGWALFDSGEIILMDICIDGEVGTYDSSSNFDRLVYSVKDLSRETGDIFNEVQ